MDITIAGISAAVLVGILAELAKKAGIDIKFIPILSVVFGIAVVCLGTWNLNIEAVVTGIVIGATTSGLYSNVQKGREIIFGNSK